MRCPKLLCLLLLSSALLASARQLSQVVNNNLNGNQNENNNVQAAVVSQNNQVSVAASNTVDGQGAAAKLNIQEGTGATPGGSATLTNAATQGAAITLGQVGGDQIQAASVVNNFPTPPPPPPPKDECMTGEVGAAGSRQCRPVLVPSGNEPAGCHPADMDCKKDEECVGGKCRPKPPPPPPKCKDGACAARGARMHATPLAGGAGVCHALNGPLLLPLLCRQGVPARRGLRGRQVREAQAGMRRQ